MVADIRSRAQRHDRWISWLMLGIVLVALVLGWVVKSAAESRSSPFTTPDGLSLRYPAGWILSKNVQSPTLFQADDSLALPFRSSLLLQRHPLPAVDNPLGAVQQNLALDRSRSWTAFRILTTQDNVSIQGRTALHVTFAYVEPNRNPFLETVPVVMHGEDYLFAVGSDAYVVTLTAAEPNFAQAQKALRDLIRYLPR